MPGAFDDLIPPPSTGTLPSAANAFADLIPPRGYRLVPVEGDPFAAFPDAPPAVPQGGGPRFVPVDHDPFAGFPDAPAATSPTAQTGAAASMPAAGAQPVAAQGLPPDSGFAPPPAHDGSGDPWWKRAGRYVNDTVRATANAVPILGALADKADAATDAALSGKSYDQALTSQQAEDAQFADAHPYSKLAADLAGAGGGTVAMLPAAGLGLGPSSTMAALGVDTAGIGGRMATAAAARGNDVGTGAAIGTLVRRALEIAGIEFIPENGGGAGVRLRKAGI